MADTYRIRQQRREAEDTAAPASTSPPAAANPTERLVSLDAYRGFIMVMLAASGFGIYHFAELPQDAPVWQQQNYGTWQSLAFQFEHPEWVSKIGLMGVSFWDLIQPAFMFMVGVAMPFSYAKREAEGQSAGHRLVHAALRALILVLMGVFLYSIGEPRTNWVFTNVLAQIGLGYFFAYLLLGRKEWVQWTAFVLILVGTCYIFQRYNPMTTTTESATTQQDVIPDGGRTIVFGPQSASPWAKNANAAHVFDVWFLNLLRDPSDDQLAAAGATADAGDWAPKIIRDWFFSNDEAFESNRGGYQTLNFVPSVATTLLGILCGQFLIRRRQDGTSNDWQTVAILVGWGVLLMAIALVAHAYVCPIVKRIWTPSWVLFSGAYVIWMLALFFALFDVLPLKKLAFPLAVVGMNSIAIYLMGQTIRGWTINNVVHPHFTGFLSTIFGEQALADNMYGRLIDPTMAFLVFWLILYWMYRQRYFLRV